MLSPENICTQICYFIYKNIAFGLTLFYFEAYTSFSGQSIYDDWYMILFNVILTSLPVISLGALEQDVSSEVCLQVGSFTYSIKFRMFCKYPRWNFTFLNRLGFSVSSIIPTGTKELVL